MSHAKLTYADAVVKEGADMLGKASSMEIEVFLSISHVICLLASNLKEVLDLRSSCDL